MSRRTLGGILLALGLGGLVVTGAGWWGPPVAWHRTMHGWMHGGQVAVAPAPPLPGAPELEVTARDLAFSPAEPSVTAGETVNVVLRNEGAAFHDLTIPALGFRLEAGPGDTAAASLTVPAPGRYRFLCSVPGHAEAGMIGTLVAR